MTYAESFLKDIFDHPNDDAPRLIFADWLEEQGRVEEARFLRTQRLAILTFVLIVRAVNRVGDTLIDLGDVAARMAPAFRAMAGQLVEMSRTLGRALDNPPGR
jgi:uncharacterized protein (TIGR02996 family)